MKSKQTVSCTCPAPKLAFRYSLLKLFLFLTPIVYHLTLLRLYCHWIWDMDNTDMFLCCFKEKTISLRLEQLKARQEKEGTPTDDTASLTPLQYSVKTAIEGKFCYFQCSITVSVFTNHLQQHSRELVLQAYRPGLWWIYMWTATAAKCTSYASLVARNQNAFVVGRQWKQPMCYIWKRKWKWRPGTSGYCIGKLLLWLHLMYLSDIL